MALTAGDRVDGICAEVAARADDWELIDALLGGSEAMRKAATKYLPKRNFEQIGDYQARLRIATLFPLFAETVKSMVGRVLGRGIVRNADIPARIVDEILPNVDLEGRDLDQLARDWFHDAVAYGLSFLLVDYPDAQGAVTAADMPQARPYAVLVKHNQVIGWRTELSGGAPTLSQVRISEQVKIDQGQFGTQDVAQIRVLTPGAWETYRLNAAHDWAPFAKGTTSIDRIPLVALYAGRTGVMTAAPPLLDLAHLNAKHWKQQADRDALLETASVPILAAIGVVDETPITVGEKYALKLPHGAELKFVEHSGKALDAGRVALQDLVEDMRQAGAKLLRPVSGSSRTAVESSGDLAKETAVLSTMAANLGDSIAQALQLFAEWMRLPNGGTVSIEANLDPDYAPIESMSVLVSMAAAGMISHQSVFDEARRRGIIDDERDWATERLRVDAEGPLAPADAPKAPQITRVSGLPDGG